MPFNEMRGLEMKRLLIFALAFVFSGCGMLTAQLANYPEIQMLPYYAADTGAVNVLAGTLQSCPAFYTTGALLRVLPGHANTTTTPTFNLCGLGAKTITKFGQAALIANDLTTTAVAVLVYDGTYLELLNPQTSSSSGTVTSIATTGPISGGTISTTGTISCPTCATSAAALGNGYLIVGAGSQGEQALSSDVVATGTGIYTTYGGIATAGLGFAVVEGVSDVTAQVANQTTVNLVASTSAAGHYLVRIYVDQNALCTTGTGSVFAPVSWTDATHAHTAVTVPLTLANTAISSSAGFIDAAIPLWSVTSSPIAYTTTSTACTSGTGSYDLHAEVERTN